LQDQQGGQLGDLLVAAGQCVSDNIERARLVLDNEVLAQQLASPLVLRDRRQALVQEEAEAPVVSADDESAPPQVRPPMAHGPHQIDQIALVGCELGVAWRNWPAEHRSRNRTRRIRR
jgi:hypothetical protein